MENPIRRLSRNDIIIHGLNTPLTGWGMNVDGRPRLASLPAIKDELTRESQERARVQRLASSRVIPTGTRISSLRVGPLMWGCTPRPGQDRIAYTADAVVQDVQDNVTKATAYVIDVLDVLGPTSDDIARWLLRLDDTCTNPDVDVYILIDTSMHSSHDIARWSSITPTLFLQSEHTTTSDVLVHGASATAQQNAPAANDDSAETNELRHLTRLPAGFSVDALRRRILQWRRMGFDVSDLESALIQDDDEREQMYRHVEACVRRAIDLDRQLTQFAATYRDDVEHCRFRLRQLTGLDDVASKLSSEHVELSITRP